MKSEELGQDLSGGILLVVRLGRGVSYQVRQYKGFQSFVMGYDELQHPLAHA